MPETLTVEVWIDRLPLWQQDLVCRVFESVEPEPDVFEIAVKVVMAAFGIPFEGPSPSMRTFNPAMLSSANAGENSRITKLGPLHGVGMIVEDSEIPFNPVGITVVFGHNAAGKSSFVRCLKVLSGSVDLEGRPWGNVYEETGVDPTAHVEYATGEIEHVLDSPLTGPDIERLLGISVFDSACAELYVDEKNVIHYVPTELLILSRLASFQMRLRHHLDELRTAIEVRKPSFDDFPEDTEAGVALRALSAMSQPSDLIDLCAVGEDHARRIVELRVAITAVEASTAHQDSVAVLSDATQARELIDVLRNVVSLVDDAGTVALVELAQASDTTSRALNIAIEEFSSAPISGIGTEPWQLMWIAAREFVAAQNGLFPPSIGEECPLCLQPVDESTAERLRHFGDHVTGNVRALSDGAKDALNQALKARNPHSLNILESPITTQLSAREPLISVPIISFIEQLNEHLEAVIASPLQATSLDTSPTEALSALEAWASERQSLGERLQAATVTTGAEAMRIELRNLLAKELLHERIALFTSWIADLKILDGLNRAKRELATNKVTNFQGDRTEAIVGERLRESLSAELTLLNCNDLPIEADLSRHFGQTSAVLQLVARQSASLKSIASEGEWRAIALAFFFAELSARDDDAGIVLDDPVSSLDDQRRKYIARRIVDESQRRQVVLFTHDLPFIADMQEHAKSLSLEIKTCALWRHHNSVGRFEPEMPFKALPLKKRLGQLRVRAAQWNGEPQPASEDEAWRKTQQFYRDLRSSWERAVEERLFKGVVQRLQRGVQTQKLGAVEISRDLIDRVNAGMTRTSEFLHDEAEAATIPLPSREQIEADLESLIQFEREVTAD